MNDTNMKQFMEADLSKDGFDVATSKLKFSARNHKLGDISTFSLPAGHSCPFAKDSKALPFWVKRMATLPENFRLTASFGGTHDHLISEHNLKFAKVVESLEEAVKLGLPIDHDDSHAYGDNKKSFALLVHGQQPAGSKWAKAWMALKKVGMGGYGKDKHKTVAGAKSVSTVGVHPTI